MDTNNGKYSNIALWVAGIAALLTLGYWYIQRTFDLYAQIGLGVFAISVALYVYFDPDRAMNLIRGRQARFGSNAVLLFLAFLASVSVINYLVYQNAQELGLRWDLTEDRERTLSAETVNTLNEISNGDSPVIVRAFYTAQNPSQIRVRELLEDYKFVGGENFLYEFIDPNENPVAANNAGITRDGTLLFTLGADVQRVTVISEQEFTTALISLLSPNNKTVYFLTGHGEYNVDQAGDDSLIVLRAALENKNYVVESLNLLFEAAIPDDAVAIVLAGPLQPVTDAEISLISEFAASGGALIVAQDPLVQTEFTSGADPMNDYLEVAWGISLGDDIVIEPQVIQTLGGLFAASVEFGNQEISNDLNQRGLSTVFLLARSVMIVDAAVPNVIQTALIRSSPASWAETNIDSINDGTSAPDEQDVAGPVALAVAAENSLTGGRLVVIGDSDFLSDAGISQFGNQDLILNAIDWSTNQENLITLTPRTVTQRLLVPPNQNTLSIIAILTVCLVPGAVLGAGILVYVSRKRQV